MWEDRGPVNPPDAEPTPHAHYNRPTHADWAKMETAMANGATFPEVARQFNVKENSLRKHARTNKWVTAKSIKLAISAEIKRTAGQQVAKVAKDWLSEGDSLRELAFNKAHESIKLFRPKPPKNFRELESAVKVARQAAGLDTADVQIATLITLNERMENFDDEQPIEASSVVLEGEFTTVSAPNVPEAGAEASTPDGEVAAQVPEAPPDPVEQLSPEPEHTAVPEAESGPTL